MMRPSVGSDFLPEIAGGVVGDLVQINHSGMGFGAVAQKITLGRAQIDGKAKPVGNDRRAADQRFAGVQGGKGGIIQRRLTLAEPDLVQPLPGPHQN